MAKLVKQSESTPEKELGTSLIKKLLELFGFGGVDSEKKKQLKNIAKTITHSRYKFYKPKSREALPGIARFFYETYRVIAPSQIMLTNAVQSGLLKAFVIESFLTSEQKKYADMLTDDYIREQAKLMNIQNLHDSIKKTMATFFSAFDKDIVARIDNAYTTILSFIHFANFDFFFLVKKFDSNVTERSFTYTPQFATISGDYIVDDLHDFLEVFLPLNLDADWKHIFTALKEYKNMDVIQIDSWVKLASALKDVRNSDILNNIVLHLKESPDLVVIPKQSTDRIVEPYLEKIKMQTTQILQKLMQEKRNSKIDEIAQFIFGSTNIVRLKHYTENMNTVFARKKITGFTQTQSLSYLKAYLLDFFKKDVRELVDVLLIRGQWATNGQSQELSDNYHALLEITESILSFDDSVSDEGEFGSKLRNAISRTERDRDNDASKYAQQLIQSIDERAIDIIKQAARNMVNIGRYLKLLIDDAAKARHEVIVNWKEVENAFEKPIRVAMAETYKKIYYMIQLLQYYIK